MVMMSMNDQGSRAHVPVLGLEAADDDDLPEVPSLSNEAPVGGTMGATSEAHVPVLGARISGPPVPRIGKATDPSCVTTLDDAVAVGLGFLLFKRGRRRKG